jgi:hypothetical protein
LSETARLLLNKVKVRFEFQQQNPLATAAASLVWGNGARASYFS